MQWILSPMATDGSWYKTHTGLPPMSDHFIVHSVVVDYGKYDYNYL